MKGIYPILILFLCLGMITACYLKVSSPEYAKDFNYKGGWSKLRTDLHALSVSQNLTFMDTSYAYPSGNKTLNIQIGRLSDKLKIAVVGVDSVETIGLSIDCESASPCDNWEKLKDDLSTILQNP